MTFPDAAALFEGVGAAFATAEGVDELLLLAVSVAITTTVEPGTRAGTEEDEEELEEDEELVVEDDVNEDVEVVAVAIGPAVAMNLESEGLKVRHGGT